MPYLKRDGDDLFYREVGEGPLLLVLPGNTSSSACHRGELEFFGRGYRAVSLDFRGTGRSGRMERWPDDWWEISADDVAALIRHLNGDGPALVMGTSGGGVIALKTAIRNPGVVKAVVADSCIGKMPQGWVERLIQERQAETQEQVGFWSYAHGEDWRRAVAGDSDLFRRFGESGSDWFQDTLSAIRCPVLLTASLRDAALPGVGAQVAEMVEQIPRGEAHLFGAGEHPLMWTRPEAFRRVAMSFLESLDGRGE